MTNPIRSAEARATPERTAAEALIRLALAEDLGAAGDITTRALDLKNPKSAKAQEHLPPEQLADDILAQERRIIEIMEEIKAELVGAQV